MNHVMAMTYPPKIPFVISGECNQTMRPRGKRPKKVGDHTLIHGWECKKCNSDYIMKEKNSLILTCPKCTTRHSYRTSKWSWKKEAEIIEVIDIGMNQHGIFIKDLKEFLDYLDYDTNLMDTGGQDFLRWSERLLNTLAELDFIEPSTGIEMGKLFNSMYDLSEIMPFQIISWKVLEEKN